jgi:acetylserotonin N-methyltransferase
MFAAVSLGVFDALEPGPLSLQALAERLESNRDALERLLDACVGLSLLVRRDGLYENTAVAHTYLCEHSPLRMTGYLNYSNEFLWKMWGNLEGAVREGTHRWHQTFGWDGPIFSSFFRTEDAKREFLMGMHAQGQLSSPKVVAAFDLSRFRRLVDLGGATGHLAIAACERYPTLRATVLDLPEVVGLAREVVGASSVSERIDVIPGDFFSDSLPDADLFSLGRIIHDWTEAKAKKLLERIHETLPTGGALLIAEKLLAPDKSGPSWAQMQNLNMLVCTEGKERTLDEYRVLLADAGFSRVEGATTASPLDAIIALK